MQRQLKYHQQHTTIPMSNQRGLFLIISWALVHYQVLLWILSDIFQVFLAKAWNSIYFCVMDHKWQLNGHFLTQAAYVYNHMIYQSVTSLTRVKILLQILADIATDPYKQTHIPGDSQLGGRWYPWLQFKVRIFLVHPWCHRNWQIIRNILYLVASCLTLFHSPDYTWKHRRNKFPWTNLQFFADQMETLLIHKLSTYPWLKTFTYNFNFISFQLFLPWMQQFPCKNSSSHNDMYCLLSNRGTCGLTASIET